MSSHQIIRTKQGFEVYSIGSDKLYYLDTFTKYSDAVNYTKVFS